MNFRKATFLDLPAIVNMLADDELGQTRESVHGEVPVEYEVAFNNIIADVNQELMVMVNAEAEVVGTLQLSFIQYLTYTGGLRAQIEAVRVRKDQRGLGIGKLMFQKAISRAKERNAHVVQLTTNKLRENALLFYRELGFVDSHEGMKLHLK